MSYHCSWGALVEFSKEYSGVKDTHCGPTDPVTRPVRSADILLRGKATGKRLLLLEGVAILRVPWVLSCIQCEI